MKVSAYIIHLRRATERAENVNKLTRKLSVPVIVIPAVDHMSLGEPEISSRYVRDLYSPRYPFSLTANEIACFLSHRASWLAIAQSGDDAGLVFEDDAELDTTFQGAFDFACDEIRDGDLIRFPIRENRGIGNIRLNRSQYQIYEPTPVGLGMVAQLISRRAAIKLLQATQTFDRPVDTLLQMYWITGVRPYSISPSGVREISSLLGGSLLGSRKTLVSRVRREVQRPIYRNKIRKLSQ